MNVMKPVAGKGQSRFVGLAVLALVCATANVWSATDPLKPKDVMCGDVKCGTLEVDKLQTSTVNAGANFDGYLGLDITGKFVPTVANKTFHFIQGITSYNSTDRRWINDASVPINVPFLDTPPGGYLVKSPWNDPGWTAPQQFDTLPYYDEPADNPPFPAFYDSPGMWMQPAKSGALSWSFETWLVCVIDGCWDRMQARQGTTNTPWRHCSDFTGVLTSPTRISGSSERTSSRISPCHLRISTGMQRRRLPGRMRWVPSMAPEPSRTSMTLRLVPAKTASSRCPSLGLCC